MGDDGIGGYRDEQMPIVTSPTSPLALAARDAEGELERSSDARMEGMGYWMGYWMGGIGFFWIFGG